MSDNMVRKAQVNTAYDAVVIGGGPAGAACAALLAQRGRRIVLIERKKFPRYHIGESLLTGALSVLEDLDLLERTEQLPGAVKKYGGTLRWGTGTETWNFRFADASNYQYAFQVRRADFDSLLLARARELGVTVLEDCSVESVSFEDDRAVGIEYKDRSGVYSKIAASYTIDASGQARFLARQFGSVSWNERFQNLATWAYFQGCQRYDGTRAGDVLTEHTKRGWFWFVPLADGTTSVGFVCPQHSAPKSAAGMRQLFEEEITKTTEVNRMMGDAVLVSSFRNAKDWSYVNDAMAGPGWGMTGDAAAFVDPLMATGVTLAMRSARGLATEIDEVLSGMTEEAQFVDRYNRRYHRVIGQVLEFVSFLYETRHPKEEYWDKAQELVDPGGNNPRTRDFVTVMSGLNGMFATDQEKLEFAELRARMAMQSSASRGF